MPDQQQVSTTPVYSPPDLRTVVCRTHCLGALVQRWEYEQTIQGFNELSIVEIHRKMVADLAAWLQSEELTSYLTREEEAILGVPLGHWRKEMIDRIGWKIETLGVLVWALSLSKKITPYDQRCHHDDLLIRLRIGKSILPTIEKARLRSTEELARAQKAATLWQWRAQTAQVLSTLNALSDQGALPGSITSTAEAAWHKGVLPEPLDGDFSAFGRPYREASSERVDLLSTIAHTRAKGLKWLMGQLDDQSSSSESLPSKAS